MILANGWSRISNQYKNTDYKMQMTSRTSSPPSLPKTMSAKCSDSYHQLSKKLKATLPSRERHIPDPTTIVSILTKIEIHWQTWTSKENKTGS